MIHSLERIASSLPKVPSTSKTAPPTGDLVFKHVSLWRTFHTQTTQLCQDLSCLRPCIQDCVILLLPHSLPDMMISFLLKLQPLKAARIPLMAFSCSSPPVPFHFSTSLVASSPHQTVPLKLRKA